MYDFFRFSDSQRARIAPLLTTDMRGRNRPETVDDRPAERDRPGAAPAAEKGALAPRASMGYRPHRRWMQHRAPRRLRPQGPPHVLSIASCSRRPETCMIARPHSAASRPCRHPPKLSPTKVVTAGNCANGLKSAGPGPSSRRERPARSDITTIGPSTGSEISSNACSAASKTGGASRLASSATLKRHGSYRARRSPHLVAIMSPDTRSSLRISLSSSRSATIFLRRRFSFSSAFNPDN